MYKKSDNKQCKSAKLSALSDTRIDNPNPTKGLRFVKKHEAAGILGISTETLKKYRLQEGSTLIEGIHYHVWNSRTIRYNAELLVDWGLNRNSPEIHQRTIELYLASLATNQNRRGKRSHPTA